jgi:hypothetical protein
MTGMAEQTHAVVGRAEGTAIACPVAIGAARGGWAGALAAGAPDEATIAVHMIYSEPVGMGDWAGAAVPARRPAGTAAATAQRGKDCTLIAAAAPAAVLGAACSAAGDGAAVGEQGMTDITVLGAWSPLG